jgi:succinoglycan biosynthesis protein ExoA
MSERGSETPGVSILVPCRNEKDSIAACIRSILSQYPPPGNFEVIVSDGMSDDGTLGVLQQLAKEDSRLRIIPNPARIVSTGLNLAIGVAKGNVIIRMDAHTTYAKDYVQQCVQVLKETGADNVGGPARTLSFGYCSSAICAAYHSPFSVGGAKFHNLEYEGYADTVPYGCWGKNVFEKIGLFDEELVRNQDDEFNLRMTRHGGTIWQSPRIRSWYRPRGSLRSLFRQYMQYGYWKVRVIQKHKLPASIRHIIPGSFVLAVALLPVLSLMWAPALWVWVGLLGMYGCVNILASVATARREGWRLLWLLPCVFACYHFSYGYGFLRGVWDFLVRRKGPQKVFTSLSRQSA